MCTFVSALVKSHFLLTHLTDETDFNFHGYKVDCGCKC